MEQTSTFPPLSTLQSLTVSRSAFFNDITYVRPKVPTLYTALSAGSLADNATIYSQNTNPFILNHNDIIEIVLNNDDPGKHPFHLHGHAFQAVGRSDEDEGQYVDNQTFPAVPMRRDTFMVRPMGNIVLRFRADNPDESLLTLSLPPPSSPLSLYIPPHPPNQTHKLTSYPPLSTHLALPLPHRMARRLRPHCHPHRIPNKTPIIPHHPTRPPRRLRCPKHPHGWQRGRQHGRLFGFEGGETAAR